MTSLINPSKNWQPPHCPHVNCKSHGQLPDQWEYYHISPYYRRTDNRNIQRYKCVSCEGTFSTQTFSTTYWQKRPNLDEKIFTHSVNGMANSQIARVLGCAPSTVDRKLARLGRHCLLFLLTMLKAGIQPDEIVYDGLETFEFSQFHPYYLNIAVEKSSDYILFLNESELRRKGTMTSQQKIKRKHLEDLHGRPDPRAIEKSTTEIFDILIEDQPKVAVFTDKHRQYTRPLLEYGSQVTHFQTSSKEHRGHNNNLFAVNRLDMMLRHGNKNHTRETIAFSKRRQAGIEKAAVFAVYMNFVMDRRQRGIKGFTPAMARGVVDRKFNYDDIFDCRRFVFKFDLPGKWKEYYFREVITRALPRNKGHTLKYAA